MNNRLILDYRQCYFIHCVMDPRVLYPHILSKITELQENVNRVYLKIRKSANHLLIAYQFNLKYRSKSIAP